MTIGNLLLIILCSLILLVVYDLITYCKTETMININAIQNPKWSRTKCDFQLGDTLKKVLDKNNINFAPSDGKLQLTCGYDEIDDEINKLEPKQDQRIFIIHNADHISAKDFLWKRLVSYFGLQKAKNIMPNTYVLYEKDDLMRLKNEFNNGKLFILKKNIQRQEGLYITDSLEEILQKSNSYVVAQELLQDPYLINVAHNDANDAKNKDFRKINIRFYVLMVCNNGIIDAYVFNDGFMYYTKEPFMKNSKKMEPNVTTGYIDRWIYEKNPLTYNDFLNYLKQNESYDVSMQTSERIHNILKDTFIATTDKACSGEKLKNNISFQLFGADVALNNKLIPMIMEVNKGPDMGSKDERDGTIKQNCTEDMLRIVGILPKINNNGFKLLFSVDNNAINNKKQKIDIIKE